MNIRLDAERLRKTQVLRERGISLSDVIRDANDERFAALGRANPPRNVREIVTQLLEAYPDPPGLPRRAYDVHNRTTAHRALQQQLRPNTRFRS